MRRLYIHRDARLWVDDRRALSQGRFGLAQVDLGRVAGPLDQLLQRGAVDVLQLLLQMDDRAGLRAGPEVHLVDARPGQLDAAPSPARGVRRGVAEPIRVESATGVD